MCFLKLLFFNIFPETYSHSTQHTHVRCTTVFRVVTAVHPSLRILHPKTETLSPLKVTPPTMTHVFPSLWTDLFWMLHINGATQNSMAGASCPLVSYFKRPSTF